MNAAAGDTASQAATPLAQVGSGGEALSSMALLGKTGLSLALIVGLILALSYLVRRLNGSRPGGGGNLIRHIASRALGPRERVVIVEVENTWLVLGVANGQVVKLHELPAGDTQGSAAASGAGGNFAQLLRSARQRSSGQPE